MPAMRKAQVPDFRWLLLFAALFVSSCTSTGTPSRTRKGLSSALPVVIWIDHAGCRDLEQSPDRAASFFRLLARAGVTHAGFETRSHTGEDIIEEQQTLRLAASQAGLGEAAIVPLFIAGEADPKSWYSQEARWTGEQYEIQTIASRPAESPRRLSPAIAEVRAREIDHIQRAAASPEVELVLLTGAGFGSETADLGPSARDAFAAWSAHAVKNWPQDVIGTHPPEIPFGPGRRGPYWDSWNRWRATVLRSFVADVDLSFVGSEHGSPRIAALVDAPYVAHQREGLNWAGPGPAPARDYDWLSPEYPSTAAGALLDAVVLGYWLPGIITAEDAENAGFAWWASMEGSTAGARQYLKDTSTEVWGAVSVESGTGWAQNVARGLETLDGIVIISASKLIEEPTTLQTLAAALRRQEVRLIQSAEAN